MTEEYNLCEVPKEDVEEFARMIWALKAEANEIAGETRERLSKYGRDVKEVQENIGCHLKKCFLCDSYYKKSLEDWVKGEKIVFANLDQNTLQDAKNFKKKKREWGIEHSAYEYPEDLRKYLFVKAISVAKNRSLELRLEFEKHIENCRSCQEVYGLQLDISKRYKRK